MSQNRQADADKAAKDAAAKAQADAEAKAAADKAAQEAADKPADGSQTVTLTVAELDDMIARKLAEQAAQRAAVPTQSTVETFEARDNVTGAPTQVVVKRRLSKKPHPVNGTFTEIYEGGSHIERTNAPTVIDEDDDDDDE